VCGSIEPVFFHSRFDNSLRTAAAERLAK